ncbi:ragulator complex protein LAMTOR3 homolog [Drosophila suzukii]|uniref:Ragulator complex protein LAMTOR3 homolog n=2 Tax=melanogaster group TaxID=32346 RepID=A0A6P4FIN9_DRORH|nr:ragulator complex protein LAMTOR3 homolog [Drosophila suzukii]XP_016963272.1 ragulator complex protein LAMTOR3 homolog [Drosophila biarmipes]XP_016987298.1 ragulator complex protein LAMTOR3 homolog [Drosophila rhopaloa]XP_016993652.1 ragulator complex protein LAMTOR3 homolog [Drosophila takahashii]XP_017044889.1 ragulator complex protein LAMTOR3 homolog [Drosophila ficusphila]XP_017063926.1 ragulator complex protein LAMTOR3 homolog [Drosophila eugracilis]XP_037710544.1 ragulator complex pr
MSDDIKKYLDGLLQKVSGLYVIQITDRDGVPLLRVSQEKNVDFALMPSFIPTFTTACDQASKLGLGRNKTIISMYSNYQVVQMNKLPLILTFVGAENCNTGHILALEHQVDGYLEDIKLAVTEA